MKNLLSLVIGLGVAAAIVLFLALTLEIYLTSEVITVTITKVERFETDGERHYLVHTNKGLFENRNSSFHRKGNTASIAQMLKKDTKYKVKVVGYNFGVELPFFFKYRNIIEVTDGPNIKVGKIK